ncbi:MAG: serine hydrolase [Clostridia bacterium]|nr:serine hydrolase [Clostridia bacterium]
MINNKKITIAIIIAAAILLSAIFVFVFFKFINNDNTPAFSEGTADGAKNSDDTITPISTDSDVDTDSEPISTETNDINTENKDSDTTTSQNDVDTTTENVGAETTNTIDIEDTTAKDTAEETTTDLITTVDTDKYEEPIYDQKKQTIFDQKCLEISEWLKTSVPRYIKEAETDEKGNQVRPPISYTPSVAFYYMDLTSGCSMGYNENVVFYTASIIKAPYVMWVLSEVEKAEAKGDVKGTKFDLNNVFVYTEDKHRTGSGIIQKSEFGTTYTYLDLLKLSITESDNIAFAELRSIYGKKGFDNFSEKIGVYNTTKKLYSASAKEMGEYFEEIFKFFNSGTKYAEMLKEWMQRTNHRVLIPRAVSPVTVASKYGWDTDAYHDSAIVFDNENPYLLVVMTGLEDGSAMDNNFIRTLISKINSVHNELK